MMSNPEPLTARDTSKGKQKLLLTSEHVSWCLSEFVESVRQSIAFRGYEISKKRADAFENNDFAPKFYPVIPNDAERIWVKGDPGAESVFLWIKQRRA
jgi:hypothetical protein